MDPLQGPPLPFRVDLDVAIDLESHQVLNYLASDPQMLVGADTIALCPHLLNSSDLADQSLIQNYLWEKSKGGISEYRTQSGHLIKLVENSRALVYGDNDLNVIQEIDIEQVVQVYLFQGKQYTLIVLKEPITSLRQLTISVQDSLLSVLFPQSHQVYCSDKALVLRKQCDALLKCIQSSERVDAEQIQQFYCRVADMVHDGSVKSMWGFTENEKPEQYDKALLSDSMNFLLDVLKQQNSSDEDQLLDYIEAKIFLSPGTFQKSFPDAKDEEWNKELECWDLLSRTVLQSTTESGGSGNDLKGIDNAGLVQSIVETEPDLVQSMKAQMKSYTQFYIANSSGPDKADDKAFGRQLAEYFYKVPLGRSIVMFAMYQSLSVSLSMSAFNQAHQYSLNSDTLFPLFVHILTQIVSEEAESGGEVIPLLLSVKFVHMYRRSSAVYRGESGWGLTNVSSVLEHIYQLQGRSLNLFDGSINNQLAQKAVSEDQASPLMLQNQSLLSRGASLAGSLVSTLTRSRTETQVPLPSKPAYQRSLLSGMERFSPRLMRSMSFKAQQENGLNRNKPLPVSGSDAVPLLSQRFLKIENADQLTLAEIPLLLEEYRKLALYVKQSLDRPSSNE
ncbi:hypothetical protein MIR68_002657 [Amoeboaphelidium protococcarum]|nr:hypothetical protein MIR68_002657 [Amoeboaphelidium protococcarum]